MKLILFDDYRHTALKPLTFTRPVADLRIGILRIIEKWERHLNQPASFLTMPYLRGSFPAKLDSENLLINGAFLPNAQLCQAIENLKLNQKLVTTHGELIAMAVATKPLTESSPNRYLKIIDQLSNNIDSVVFDGHFDALYNTTDIFVKNELALEDDYELLTKDRKSAELSEHNRIIGNRFFAEEGAKAIGASFNTTDGPIYLAANSEVMEGTTVRGGLALGEHAVLKMGAKIYGATTIGPHSKVGGEVNNCVIHGYSNKGHDGFIGNSVIGQWCNLGADTNTSNLKNNYGEVKTWSYKTESIRGSGRQFVGLVMGDHSKCGINTMFNTGTVVGVFANVFGAGFPPKFIPSFSWGGHEGFETYNLQKAFEVAEGVMARRHKPLTSADRELLTEVFEISAPFRN